MNGNMVWKGGPFVTSTLRSRKTLSVIPLLKIGHPLNDIVLLDAFMLYNQLILHLRRV
jgi:hypothetical protein